MKKLILSVLGAVALVAPAVFNNHEAIASEAVHPDCVDNAQPMLCTMVIQEIDAKVAEMRADFDGGDLDEMASTYADPGTVVAAFGEFYRGWEGYRYDFLPTLFPGELLSADFDFSTTHYQVISRDLVVQYGFVGGTATFADGSTGPMNERIVQVWARDVGKPGKPFAVVAAFYDVL